MRAVFETRFRWSGKDGEVKILIPVIRPCEWNSPYLTSSPLATHRVSGVTTLSREGGVGGRAWPDIEKPREGKPVEQVNPLKRLEEQQAEPIAYISMV